MSLSLRAESPSDVESSWDKRAYWEKKLGLKNVQWRSINKYWAHTVDPGSIGIQVSEQEKGGRASYGFRYALYLIAITYSV
jgi:hypothetical protein